MSRVWEVLAKTKEVIISEKGRILFLRILNEVCLRCQTFLPFPLFFRFSNDQKGTETSISIQVHHSKV